MRPNIRQRALAQEIIKNAKEKNRRTAGQLVESVGYSRSTSIKKPGEILDGIGVKKALQEYGFTEENAKRVVTTILNRGKEENRLKASDIIFKVHGSYAPDRNININVDITSVLEELKKASFK